MAATAASSHPLLEIVRLEEAARAARSRQELGFVVVNETHRLLPYRQAFLCRRLGRTHRLEAVSGLAQIDRTSPFHDWLVELLPEIVARGETKSCTDITADAVSEPLRSGWHEFLPPTLTVIPLPQPEPSPELYLLLAREETGLLDEAPVAVLARAYGHAWWALAKSRSPGQRLIEFWASRSRQVGLGVAVALGLAMLVPVRQSSIGAAEVTPLNYRVVAAPLDGVVATVAVKPNESVRAGDVLFRLDDTSLRHRLETARKSMGVARSEAFLSQQKAFTDLQARSEVATQEARVKEKGSTIGYLGSLMEKLTVRAPEAGVVLFGDASDWEGKPVSTGERIMTLADGASAGVTVWLPVADAIALGKGAEVRLFLHTEPLAPRRAQVIRSSFQPVLAPDGMAAYRVTAEFVTPGPPPRLGLRGTAKVYGDRVPLGYYLFRRPLAKFRQFLGA